MAFTAEEINNIANQTLQYHLRGEVFDNTIQERPLLRNLEESKRTFPGGKDNITVRVKGERESKWQGFSHDDQVGFVNPSKVQQAVYPWKELHVGLEVTYTELKNQGIAVNDAMGESITERPQAEQVRLSNLLDDKFQDHIEGSADDMSRMMWQDGTQDPLEIPGIRSLILDDPTSAGATGGIDRTVNAYWRNYAVSGINTATPANQVFVQELQKGVRQMRRYKRNPRHVMYAGQDAMDALERELRANGNFTESGFKGGSDNAVIDLGVSDLGFKGIQVFYEPELDDQGLDKYLFCVDHTGIMKMPMEGEEYKVHMPSRPHDRYVFYRSMTYTGGLVANQLNSSGVFIIA